MEKDGFEIRAIELHSLYAWDYDWVIKTMDFMVEHNYNSLVFHRNDFIDLIIYPGKYFGAPEKEYGSIHERYVEIFHKLYQYTPTRRSGPHQRRTYFKRVLEQAKRRGIKVFVENKELYFPDIILEFFPELTNNGHICASHPFWLEFLKVKYREFFEEFPEVEGIITSPATGESRVSINSNRCTCDRCKKITKPEWFDNILRAMYEEIHRAGKTLIVRDFVFNPEAHRDISTVMEKLPSDVVICLKNTPHDYYPTFPINSRIGNVGNHEQWIEFDSMGQYFGWGVGIADLTEDYRTRMKDALKKGASGYILRTDWESLDGQSTFKTPNKINLYAMSLLSKNLETSSYQICEEYLSDEGWLKAGIDESERKQAVCWYQSIISKTWDITRHICFVNDCVFSDSSLCPISCEHAFWLAEEKNSLRAWVPEKSTVFAPENIERNLLEKDNALLDAENLLKSAYPVCPFIIEEKTKWLVDRLGIMVLYAKMFKIVGTATMITKYLEETADSKDSERYISMRSRLDSDMNEMSLFESELKKFWVETDYRPHIVYTLLDPTRLECLYKDVTRRLSLLNNN